MKSGHFGQSPSFFTNFDDTKIHQNFCFDVAVEMARSKMSNSALPPRDSSQSFSAQLKRSGFFLHENKNSQELAAYKSNVCCSKILLTFISRSGSSINTAESYEGQAALSFSGLLILGLAAALSLVLFSASKGSSIK